MFKKSIYSAELGNHYNNMIETEAEEELRIDEEIEPKIFGMSYKTLDYDSTAFLTNFKVVTIKDEENRTRTALLLIFCNGKKEWFSAYIKHDPYFLVKCKKGYEDELISFLEKKFEGKFSSFQLIEKVDLEQLNHLSGIKSAYIKLSFDTLVNYGVVQRALLSKLRENKRQANKPYAHGNNANDMFSLIEDLREHDVMYSARVCIDHNIRVSFWYDLKVRKGFVQQISLNESLLEKPEFDILAFDIETTKAPLKFPTPESDQIMMISYTTNEQSYLIVNREVISQDIVDFTYQANDSLTSEVTVFNEPDEKALLIKFIKEVSRIRPLVLTTFNGDYFDIPFIILRAGKYKIDLGRDLGIIEQRNGFFVGKHVFMHLDCLYWVKRDAFLPQGSQGLKATTKAKLGYEPREVDPEKMVEMARVDPQTLCEYSVSDSFATHLLYKKHIHDFIFALCTIVPMNPDDVLRRGSGTLCEHLLMAQAFYNNIVFPNKKVEEQEKFYKGHLIESETYVGGYVECVNNGVYRADISTNFKLSPDRYEFLIENVDAIVKFFIEVECAESVDNVVNYKEVKEKIQESLLAIVENVKSASSQFIETNPLIYHVDVASMYPNIILTNRLQPTAVVNDQICSNCIFNEAKNKCKRNLGWDWKASYYPLNDIEYRKLKVDHIDKDLKPAIKSYCQKNYKCAHKNIVEYREDTVCMRENSFYVDTIRDFRDRRYRYKGLAKTYSMKALEFRKENNDKKANESNVLSVLYDSLQLAHKIILNSFYGYVMKKGARWYSMEMAAMVTYTGAKIIQEANGMMEALGKPLELDTDGIWTLLPQGFPEKFALELNTNKKLSLSFPCTMMNWIIHDKFKNPQYQTLVDPEKRTYAIKDEMSIFFEIDGPYKAMVIPAAREEGKKLKKRYCVFNFKGEISEIKGFEIKRRGELGIIKAFQHDIFSKFLEGTDLKSLYQACAEVSRKWLSVITEKGKDLNDERLIEMIGEIKVLSRALSSYGKQKGSAITAARRLADFLGIEMVDSPGTNCTFIISKLPEGAPLNERAIPLQVFKLDEDQKNALLKKWLKVGDASHETLKTIVDWDYYLERLSNTIQKIVVIPAILQGIDNPLPELNCPEWLNKKVFNDKNKKDQVKLTSFFNAFPKTIEDIENLYISNKMTNNISSNQKKKTKMEIEDTTPRKKSMTQPSVEDARPLSLVILKDKWKRERTKMKHESIDKIQMTTSNDLQAFTRQLENRIKNAKWHVIKVTSSPEKGYLYLWIIIDNVFLISRKVHMQKRIYVNSMTKEPQGLLKPCKKRLPREKTAYYLYEYLIKEQDFLYNFKNLEYYYTNPSIEGVYETAVPLDFRMLADISSYCTLDIAQYNPHNNYVEASALVSEEKEDVPSLFSDSVFGGRTKFVYIWGIEAKGKQLVLLFSENNVWVYKLQNYDEDGKNKIKYINKIKSLLAKDNDKNATIQLDDANVYYHAYSDPLVLKQAITNTISTFKASLKFSPGLIVLDTNSSFLTEAVKGVENELPALVLKTINLAQITYSSLDWLFVFAEKGIESYKKIETLLLQYDNLAQFTKIPVCNFKPTLEETVIYAIDVLFARELNKSFYVWWYSKTQTPDLGTNNLTNLSADEFITQLNLDCEYSKPLISQNYVFEIDIAMFHFNALIVSDTIMDMAKEFITTNVSNSGMRKVYDDEICDNKVGSKIIKDLFLKWYQSVLMDQNETANLLLQNLVRWMCSEKSAFFEPYLKKNLDRVVKRIFEDFINKLRKLGATVVFASPYKVIIQTNRKTYQAANNFVQFVLKSLIKDSNFAYIIMKIVKVYKNLIFYDINNYSGINLDFEHFSDVEEVDEAAVAGKLNLTCKWGLKVFLPEPVQNYFELILNTFITKFYEFEQEITKEGLEDDSIILPHIAKQMEVYFYDEFSSQFFELISYITEQQRLCEYSIYEKSYRKEGSIKNSLYFDVQSEVKRKTIDDAESYDDDAYENDSFIDNDIDDIGFNGSEFLADKKNKAHTLNPVHEEVATPVKPKKQQKELLNWKFPNVLGRKVVFDNIALEFIKTVFEILNKDNRHFNEIMITVKTNFLKYIQISPYDDETKYQDMCLKVKILDVICDKCFMVRTLDLFVDFDYSEKCWNCFCGAKYSLSIIENKVIKYIKNFISFMMSQDAHCINCKGARATYLSKYCSCGGKFTRHKYDALEEFIGEVQRNFVNFKQLAIACDFRLLADLVSTIHL